LLVACATRTLRGLEQVVRNDPLTSGPVAPQFNAGHEEDAPAYEPLQRLVPAMDAGKQFQQFVSAPVHVDEPRLGGLLVVLAVHYPVVADLSIVLGIEQQVVGGHLAAGEKVLRHPVARVTDFEWVRESTMGKYVDEQQAIGIDPRSNFVKQALIVPHVLHHFDGNDAVKPLTGFEIIDVGGDDAEVGKTPLESLVLDVLALGVRVRQAHDGAVGEPCRRVQRERAPSAPEIEDGMSVFDLCALCGEVQHSALRCVERIALLPIAATVLAMAAQD